jgi:hypothetical protein
MLLIAPWMPVSPIPGVRKIAYRRGFDTFCLASPENPVLLNSTILAGGTICFAAQKWYPHIESR